MDQVKERILELAEKHLKDKGLELIELIIDHQRKNHLIQILADKPEGGITVEECARLNKDIGRELEEENIFEGSYTLEVSSPGIDRPLCTEKDFLRNIGKKVQVFLRIPIDERFEYEGSIHSVRDGCLFIDVEGEIRQISFDTVNNAKQAI
ncbi:MAG: ribosome maturation factor RimP [Candidatus Aceula meridiana]|nr:ribosome maturation factor RimP [Candidatus Aceula meridiana]